MISQQITLTLHAKISDPISAENNKVQQTNASLFHIFKKVLHLNLTICHKSLDLIFTVYCSNFYQKCYATLAKIASEYKIELKGLNN